MKTAVTTTLGITAHKFVVAVETPHGNALEFTYCGKVNPGYITNDWAIVTCKECLKHKPKETLS